MQQQVTNSSTPGSLPTLQSGWEHHQAGQYTLAEQIFRQFLHANPSHAQAWRLLGLTCQAQNKFAEAETNFRQSLHFHSGDGETHNELGVSPVSYTHLTLPTNREV